MVRESQRIMASAIVMTTMANVNCSICKRLEQRHKLLESKVFNYQIREHESTVNSVLVESMLSPRAKPTAACAARPMNESTTLAANVKLYHITGKSRACNGFSVNFNLFWKHKNLFQPGGIHPCPFCVQDSKPDPTFIAD